MTNSLDPDQNATVCSWSTLFASILNSSVMLSNYFQQTTSADDISDAFFQPHCDLRVVRTTAYFKAIMEVYRILVKLSTHYDAEVSCLKCVICMHFYN